MLLVDGARHSRAFCGLPKVFIGSVPPFARARRIYDKQADVIEQVLVSDVLAKTAKEGFADRIDLLAWPAVNCFADWFEAEWDVGAIESLRDAVSPVSSALR
jgi:hypothetical protein